MFDRFRKGKWYLFIMTVQGVTPDGRMRMGTCAQEIKWKGTKLEAFKYYLEQTADHSGIPQGSAFVIFWSMERVPNPKNSAGEKSDKGRK